MKIKMKNPFFSVIIPVYKIRKDFLSTCITSIVSQSFRDIEVLIVDDRSPDGCGILCDNYAEEDERIKVIHQINQGVSVARNVGVEAACGKWIMFVDPDDWVKENTYEMLYNHLRNSDLDILMFRHVKVVDGKYEILKFALAPNIVYDTSDVSVKEELYRLGMGPKQVGYYGFQYCWDKIYSREFLIKHDIRFPVGIPKSQDKVFVLRCLEKVRKFQLIDDVVYCYRQNIDSVCYRYSENADISRVKLAEVLIPISHRMDDEIGKIKGCVKGRYTVIYNECINFLFFIITDILFLKFFHPDNPLCNKERFRQARHFVQSEPFKKVIKQVKYSDLSKARKIKKILLSTGCVRIYYILFKKIRKL